MSKLRPPNPVLSLASKLPTTEFSGSEEAATRLPRGFDLSRCGAVRKRSLIDNAFIDGTKKLSFKIQANGIEQEAGVPGRNAMAEIENLKNSAERCFELASSSDFLEEDVALEAFELLTANQYDCVLAHGLGVSL